MHNRGALKIFLAVLYSVIFLLFGNFINKNTLLAYELSFRVLNNSTKTISKIEFLPVKQNFNSNEKIIWDINNFPLRDGDFTDIQIIGVHVNEIKNEHRHGVVFMVALKIQQIIFCL